MANSKRRRKDKLGSAVNIHRPAKQALAMEEIASALALHLEGNCCYTCRHRYAGEAQRQQVQLETIHETKDGKKFRVVTQYDESFMIVGLVDTVELVDTSTVH